VKLEAKENTLKAAADKEIAALANEKKEQESKLQALVQAAKEGNLSDIGLKTVTDAAKKAAEEEKAWQTKIAEDAKKAAEDAKKAAEDAKKAAEVEKARLVKFAEDAKRAAEQEKLELAKIAEATAEAAKEGNLTEIALQKAKEEAKRKEIEV